MNRLSYPLKVTTVDPAPFRRSVQDVYKQFAPQVGAALLNKVIEAGN